LNLSFKPLAIDIYAIIPHIPLRFHLIALDFVMNKHGMCADKSW